MTSEAKSSNEQLFDNALESVRALQRSNDWQAYRDDLAGLMATREEGDLRKAELSELIQRVDDRIAGKEVVVPETLNGHPISKDAAELVRQLVTRRKMMSPEMWAAWPVCVADDSPVSVMDESLAQTMDPWEEVFVNQGMEMVLALIAVSRDSALIDPMSSASGFSGLRDSYRFRQAHRLNPNLAFYDVGPVYQPWSLGGLATDLLLVAYPGGSTRELLEMSPEALQAHLFGWWEENRALSRLELARVYWERGTSAQKLGALTLLAGEGNADDVQRVEKAILEGDDIGFVEKSCYAWVRLRRADASGFCEKCVEWFGYVAGDEGSREPFLRSLRLLTDGSSAESVAERLIRGEISVEAATGDLAEFVGQCPAALSPTMAELMKSPISSGERRRLLKWWTGFAVNHTQYLIDGPGMDRYLKQSAPVLSVSRGDWAELLTMDFDDSNLPNELELGSTNGRMAEALVTVFDPWRSRDSRGVWLVRGIGAYYEWLNVLARRMVDEDGWIPSYEGVSEESAGAMASEIEGMPREEMLTYVDGLPLRKVPVFAKMLEPKTMPHRGTLWDGALVAPRAEIVDLLTLILPVHVFGDVPETLSEAVYQQLHGKDASLDLAKELVKDSLRRVQAYGSHAIMIGSAGNRGVGGVAFATLFPLRTGENLLPGCEQVLDEHDLLAPLLDGRAVTGVALVNGGQPMKCHARYLNEEGELVDVETLDLADVHGWEESSSPVGWPGLYLIALSAQDVKQWNSKNDEMSK